MMLCICHPMDGGSGNPIEVRDLPRRFGVAAVESPEGGCAQLYMRNLWPRGSGVQVNMNMPEFLHIKTRAVPVSAFKMHGIPETVFHERRTWHEGTLVSLSVSSRCLLYDMVWTNKRSNGHQDLLDRHSERSITIKWAPLVPKNGQR